MKLIKHIKQAELNKGCTLVQGSVKEFGWDQCE